MASDEMMEIVIVFRPTQGQKDAERTEYTISRAERDRLVREMTENPMSIGAFDAWWGKSPRKLVLRFSDILYIG